MFLVVIGLDAIIENCVDTAGFASYTLCGLDSQNLDSEEMMMMLRMLMLRTW
jgi:hypothetical protein